MFIKWIKEIWNKKFFIVYICFLSILLVFFINNFLIKREYKYSFSYYITNSEIADLVFNESRLEEDAKMAGSCRILLQSDYTTNILAEMLIDKYGTDYLGNYFTIVEDEEGTGINTEELKKCIDVSLPSEGIAVLDVEIKTSSPYLTQSLGEFMTFLTPNVIYRIVGTGYISPFDNARMSTGQPPLGKKVVLVLGLCLGFVLSIIIISLHRRIYKNIITDKDDVKSCSSAEIYTLGDIPYYEFDIEEGKVGKDKV